MSGAGRSEQPVLHDETSALARIEPRDLIADFAAGDEIDLSSLLDALSGEPPRAAGVAAAGGDTVPEAVPMAGFVVPVPPPLLGPEPHDDLLNIVVI